MSGIEMEQCDIPDILAMLSYLSQVYDTFRREIPHIKHPKLVFKLLLLFNKIVKIINFKTIFRKTVTMDQHQLKVVLECMLLEIIIVLLIQKFLH